MKTFIKIILVGTSTIAINVQGADLTLSDYVANEVTSLDSAFSELGELNESKEDNEAYFFRRFWLRLRPKVGLKVPGFATFEVIPEVEMLWEKEAPEGWETYKP